MAIENDYETKIHKGGTIAWDASENILNWLNANVKPGMTSLETGAGKTSLIFLKNGSNHHTITPSSDEIANIKKEAARLGLDGEKINFHEGFSQNILPYLDMNEMLDIVLIDGGHGFPIPAVDFMYTAPRLKVGGKMLIDDVDLWTGQMLVDVLKNEPEWRLDSIERGRTAIFTLLSPYFAREWCDQKTVVNKSKAPQFLRKLKNAIGIILKADFKQFSKKLNQEQALIKSSKE